MDLWILSSSFPNMSEPLMYESFMLGNYSDDNLHNATNHSFTKTSTVAIAFIYFVVCALGFSGNALVIYVFTLCQDEDSHHHLHLQFSCGWCAFYDEPSFHCHPVSPGSLLGGHDCRLSQSVHQHFLFDGNGVYYQVHQVEEALNVQDHQPGSVGVSLLVNRLSLSTAD